MDKKPIILVIGILFFSIISISYAEQPAEKLSKELMKISLELTNIPITTAITQIAKSGNFSVVISPEVPNVMITATFKNVPADLALQTVCDAAGLTIQKKEANVYLISIKGWRDSDISEMMREIVPSAISEAKKVIEEKISTPILQTCPMCTKQFRAYAKPEFCPYCGASMVTKCKSCAKKITDPDWCYCPYCGKKLKK
ncbi:MAG: hypothetical protein N3A72_02100 [bacterium]|nr:hypothetical protein [bacterium]